MSLNDDIKIFWFSQSREIIESQRKRGWTRDFKNKILETLQWLQLIRKGIFQLIYFFIHCAVLIVKKEFEAGCIQRQKVKVLKGNKYSINKNMKKQDKLSSVLAPWLKRSLKTQTSGWNVTLNSMSPPLHCMFIPLLQSTLTLLLYWICLFWGYQVLPCW